MHGAALGACLGLALLAGPLRAQPVDANILTGIDVSDSVSGAELREQIAGLAAAVRSPDVQAAIRRGRHGRIGFAVFAWYYRHFPTILGWRVIGSAAEAEAAARAIEGFSVADLAGDAYRRDAFFIGRLTDLSNAIDHARALLDAAPHRAERGIVNVIGNGADNVGEDVEAAHARILDAGVTVNGVVPGGDPEVVAYYRERVAGGWGHFVITADAGASMTQAMQRKFTWEIASAGPAPMLRAGGGARVNSPLSD
jgi:hypothetical protein